MSKRGSWDLLRARLVRNQTILVSLAVAYFVSGKLGLLLSYGHPAVTLVWAPSGLALGAFLLRGYGVWPVVYGACTLVQASALGPVPAVLALAGGHTAEGLLASYLINRYAGGRQALQNPRNCLRFAGIVLFASAVVSATFSTCVLITTDFASWSDFGVLWLALSLGSLAGMVLITPQILLFTQFSRIRFTPRTILDAALAVGGVLGVGLLVFYRAPAGLRGFPTELLCMPVLLLIALRLGRRASAAALFTLTVMAIYGTLNGYGPFIRTTPFVSLTIVQFFVAVSAVMTLSLAALASEYSVADAQLRELVVTDPLTGLPNYRRLLEVIGVEISRADRTAKELAVVFFDMDGLKDINDEHGHLVGSRAVCRFADKLRAACRATDTPARYGGDEFVAILADTDHEGARALVRRITERLAEDPDQPSLSVSAGIAVYPHDGRTPTTLLSAADRALYVVKAEKANARRRSVVGLEQWSSISSR